MGSTVMIVGLGDLGGWVLEFLARREGVGTIIAADLREDWGVRKTNAAACGAAQEGYSNKTIKFQQIDVRDIDRTAELLKTINPDVIYADVTLASWSVARFLPTEMVHKWLRMTASRFVLHVVLVAKLMKAVKKAGITTHVVQHSFPDLTNPVLWRNGLGPLVGAGNMDLLVGEVKRKISLARGIPPREITVTLIAEHGLNVAGAMGVKASEIPYYIKILVRDKDVTNEFDTDALVGQRLTACPAREISWISHPTVAASAVKNIMAIINDTNEFTHAPGPIGLPGGYPIRIGAKGVEIVLPDGITMEQAIKINLDSLRFEGLEELKDDGTVVVTEEGRRYCKEILGLDYPEVRFADMDDMAKEIISVYKKIGDKHGAPVPVY